MSEPHDPFDDDETSEIYNDAVGEQIVGALDDVQDEVDAATLAIAELAIRLGEKIPPAAVINLITSVAVGTAVKETYG